jgi:hypothetical protein
MDDFDLSHVLDSGDAPAATPDVLRQVMARHRRQQMRRYRVVATSAIVVALAGAGIGVGLNQGGTTTTAASAPAGLKWDTTLGRVATGSAAESPTASGAGPSILSLGVPEPGEFGFVSSVRPLAPSSGGVSDSVGTAIPVAASTDTGGGVRLETPGGCKTGCDAVYLPDTAKLLFTTHLDGVTLRASLISFSFPLRVRVLPPVKTSPYPVGAPSQPPVTTSGTYPVTGTRSSSGSGSTASGGSPSPGSSPGSTGSGNATGSGTSTGSTGPGTVTSPPFVSVKPIPVLAACPSDAELEVTISEKSTIETLYVPVGGPGSRPFSVVASAGTTLSSGRSIILAVARTSSAVSSVSATFPTGGTETMTPKLGWSVLAEVLAKPTNLTKAGAVTLVAKSATGATLQRASLLSAGSLATAPVTTCRYLVEPVNAVAGLPTATTGSSGSSTGSGASSGAGSVPPGVPNGSTGVSSPTTSVATSTKEMIPPSAPSRPTS